jgi:CO/xanthine dehydrogenase Mo-binding subunit
MQVEGQLEGAIAMGLGQALHEELCFSSKGVLVNADMSTYRMARMNDLCPIRVELLDYEVPELPFSAKSVGEIGTMVAPAAVANAVAHACGVRLRHTPFTPWRVLEALDEQLV